MKISLRISNTLAVMARIVATSIAIVVASLLPAIIKLSITVNEITPEIMLRNDASTLTFFFVKNASVTPMSERLAKLRGEEREDVTVVATLPMSPNNVIG
jgi:ABC-type uncharacterized transport system permease subunit